MDPLKATPPQETKLHFLDYWRIIRIRKTVILAVFFLIFITATFVTYMLPPTYRSTAQIKIEQNHPDITDLREQPNYLPYDLPFIQTELLTIQSQKILNRVIENLDLNTKWGKKYYGGEKLETTDTYRLLYRQVDPVPERNSKIININVLSDEKQEAADIANEIANVYQGYRTDELHEMTERGIKTLEDRATELEKKIRAAQTELDKLRFELKINDEEAAGTGPSRLNEQKILEKYDSQRIQNEVDFFREQKLLTELTNTNLPPEKLRDIIPTAAQDQLLNTLLEELILAEQKQVNLKKSYGPESPELKQINAQVDDLNKKINNRIEGILSGLRVRVNAYQAVLDSMKKEVEAAKELDQRRATESQPYWNKKRELDDLFRQRQMLNLKIFTETTTQKIPKTTLVTSLSTAQPSKKVYRPIKSLNIAMGALLGLVVGIGLAFFIEYLDTSVKTIDDVERVLQAPVLGVIPQNVGILFEETAESPHAEAYRVLRTNLLFSRKDDKLNSLCVVSAGAGEGKSTTVFNLATIFAQSDQRVVLVDSDLRRPTLHKMFGITNSIGLTNYLLKQNTLEEVIQTTKVPKMDFLPSGKLPSSSMGILNSTQMRELILELKKRYDFVLFDSPPIMGVSDASVLASEVDMTLQVIQYRRYPQSMNVRAKQMIEKVGGNLVGIVLNNINVSQDESYYYYSGYYHDYYSKSDEAEDNASGKNSTARKSDRETKLKV